MNEKVKHIVLRSGREDDFFPSHFHDYSSRLKQHALFFDQIGILRLQNLRNMMNSTLKNKDQITKIIGSSIQTFLADTEWLQDKDIIFEPDFKLEFNSDILQRVFQESPETASVVKELATKLKKNANEPEPKDTLDKFRSDQKTDGILLRILSIVMEVNRKISATTALPFSEYIQDFPNSRLSPVTQIIINKLPMPDGTTPWERIIEYREDSNNQNNLLALRRWIRKISTQNLQSNEIEEEIEWLINEFHNCMKFHKIKANTETLEIMVKAPLEIIENLVKLRLSKLPEPLFALKKRQINLMEAELNAPGREMAYIIKTRETFQSQE